MEDPAVVFGGGETCSRYLTSGCRQYLAYHELMAATITLKKVCGIGGGFGIVQEPLPPGLQPGFRRPIIDVDVIPARAPGTTAGYHKVRWVWLQAPLEEYESGNDGGRLGERPEGGMGWFHHVVVAIRLKPRIWRGGETRWARFLVASMSESQTRSQTVIYSEREMHTELLAPLSSTVAEAKAAAVKEMTEHRHSLPGVPPTIELDETCIDMYLPVDADMTTDDIDSDIVVVIRPKPKPGSTIAPSPIMDALCDAQLDAPQPSVEVACRPSRVSPLASYSADDMHIDIYQPVNPKPDMIIGDMGDVMMTVRSKMEPGSTTSSEPIIDVYRNATAELAEHGLGRV
ncbi:hypothetical protein BD779DRAFT_1476891 [Infundibulicybe gibba]|nr:hypothetical protein BD779DRAFT_1476891 [Infundibulicybe gibba]